MTWKALVSGRLIRVLSYYTYASLLSSVNTSTCRDLVFSDMESRRLERLVLLLCCFAAITCSSPHARAQAQTTLQQQSKTSPHNGAVGRVLLETENNRSDSSLSRRTRRIDPLDGLRKYEGGYNITNEHYWSSAIFTGRSGYIIAALWLIGGILFAGFLLASKIFFAERDERCGGVIDHFLDRYHLWSLILLILLAAFAIVASAIALHGAVRFHSRAESIKEIVGRTALEATATIYNITGAIERMENTSMVYNNSSQAFDHLNSTVQTLNSEAVEIQVKAEKNMRLVSKGINTLELVTILTVTLNLVAVLVMLLGRPLRLQKLYYLCIALCWVLTALFWMYFGFYYFLDKFAGDTCAALEEYQLNPKNSTLGSIIPCSEKFSGSVLLQDVGAGIHDIINQVNSNIYTVKSEYGVKQLDYICNPFTGPPEYRYRPENCASGEATIGDIPQILKRLTCSDSGGGANCAPVDFSSAIDYDKVKTYTGSIQNVLDIFPGTERLVSCELVKAGFANIVGNQCAPLLRGVRETWAALGALSAAMALLVLASVALRRQHAGDDRHSVRHLTSSSNSEMSETEFAEMHAKRVRVQIVGP